MTIISNPYELKKYLTAYEGSVGFQGNRTVGFVPTMGALHSGHLSLIQEAKKNNEMVVVSIFVNPTQFLKGEDLSKYPRTQEADQKICEVAGVDILFLPRAEDIYTHDEVSIQAPNVRGYVLEGTSRPGHFSGVLTVVMKLLNIVNPTNAYFGKKDAQQLNLITLMVKQFFMDVNIIPVDTLREVDGLALSSRNVYLSDAQREEALKISSSLRVATSMVNKGIMDVGEIKDAMKKMLSPLEIAYVEIVDREFEPVKELEVGNSIILVEAVVGTTRLLDNIWI